ncbi:DUF2865 domain-containing protein [Agrobacterium sp. ES01]|uniref:DUF2865 domain-containing protein n=1 Tax=Agrobacterium sp. ES01 TaxID=3420714 RepID=UPI003D0C15AB
MIVGRDTLLLMIATLVALPAAANATVVCDRLRDRLVSAPQTVSADNAEIRSYSSAIARQKFEIRKTKQDIRRLHCDNSSIVTFGPNGNSSCDTLTSSLERMQQNRQILEEKRDSLKEGRAIPNSLRARLLKALDENGCNALPGHEIEQPLADEQASSPAGTLRIPDDAMRNSYAIDGWRASLQGQGGTLRTMCVRTCDGAFFPISSNATPAMFGRDAGLCDNMCPGTQTELYYHSLLSQESADMVSASTGRPYRDLPSAFAYLHRKTGDDKACGCNLTAFHQKALSYANRQQSTAAAYSAITPIKTMPDKIAPEKITIDPMERPYDPSTSTVRQVGPVFLPKETSSIDLKHPALSGAQPVQ